MGFLLFAEPQYSQNFPPAVTHVELYYGFMLVVLAWQVAFLIISRDPVRYRPLMIAAMLQKFPYGIVVLLLLSRGQVHPSIAAGGMIDLMLGTLFVISYLRTRP